MELAQASVYYKEKMHAEALSRVVRVAVLAPPTTSAQAFGVPVTASSFERRLSAEERELLRAEIDRVQRLRCKIKPPIPR